jgi:hypothetical protein
MNKFELNCKKELDLSKRCWNSANRIYKNIFGKDIKIKRFEAWENNPLDNEFGVDVIISRPTSTTFQEKFRSYEAYKRFHDVSIAEIVNGDGSDGEWYKGIAQFELYGWEDDWSEGDLVDWLIIDMNRLREVVYLNGGIESVGIGPIKNKACGSSTFYSLSIDFLRNNKCIVAEKDGFNN